MLGVPVYIQNTKLADDLVASEHLDGHDCSVFHEVAHNLTMEDLKGAVIAGVSEERKAAMKLDSSNGLRVKSHRLVRASR